ncbi:CD209 antigen-like protein E, partial [Pseudorasbora parva]|uniref:CD209 antigen-like protein E n=1 Tax=Pseudorasbora parva TaxID=51549 RepID=UPI00351DF239
KHHLHIFSHLFSCLWCSGSYSVRNRSSRAAAVCLGLLCVLLLIAVIVLCVHIQTMSTNYTEERDQLLTKITNLTEERDQLNQWNCLIRDGWIHYKFHLYFISSKKKNWTESRRYCRERGADLIIINNKEEQDFSTTLSKNAKVWIGLTDSDVEGTWKWVDGSTLTSGPALQAEHLWLLPFSAKQQVRCYA